MPSNHLCHPFLLLPSIFPSIRVFPNESALRIRWPKYWSFSFSISPFNEYSGVIFLGLTGLISLLSKRLSTVGKHQFFSTQPSLWSNSHMYIISYLYLFIWMFPKGRKLPGGANSVALSSVQSLSPLWLFATPWTVACHASLSSKPEKQGESSWGQELTFVLTLHIQCLVSSWNIASLISLVISW